MLLYLLLLLVVSSGASGQEPSPDIGRCLSAEELSLASRINQYRVDNGKPAVPLSKSLSTVAQWHAWDQQVNSPVGGSCGLHSWSAAMPQLWQPVCYTSNHAQAQQMWDKPNQITGGIYTSPGYEISSVAAGQITAEMAFTSWRFSPAHNDVMLNNGVWAPFPFLAMGVGIYGGHGNAWFGTAADPQDSISLCVPEQILSSGFE